MDFMPWKKEYEVNHKEIDSQHQNMVKLVNDLYKLMGSGKKEASKYLMKQLLTETEEHFRTEEELMKQKKYLSFISHKLEHDRYLNKLAEFYNKLLNGSASINLELLNSFRTWFVNHLQLNDIKLGNFLNTTA